MMTNVGDWVYTSVRVVPKTQSIFTRIRIGMPEEFGEEYVVVLVKCLKAEDRYFVDVASREDGKWVDLDEQDLEGDDRKVVAWTALPPIGRVEGHF